MKVVNENVVIDGIDKTILNFLMEDAKKSILEIARNIGITGAAVHQRLRKLEKAGLIEGSKIMINPRLLGYKTMAFVGVLHQQNLKSKFYHQTKKDLVNSPVLDNIQNKGD